MTAKNRQIVLAARPEGLPKPSDFRLVETPAPEPAEGQFLAKTNYLSVDPYMRGRISDAAFTQINVGARIVVCGQIDQYNATRPPRGPRLLWRLIVKQARAEGFLVFQFAGRFREGQQQVAQWIEEGRVKYQETIVDGLASAPTTLIGLFRGENLGKQLVRVSA